ncbi:MAG: gfo/Idh/MocA family oxidoreductase [Puniceicoccaceae bacterium]|nr:MAG: gfo/Idh/MocA family oxidoreductase [Puniceicoccaceae bacterium]
MNSSEPLNLAILGCGDFLRWQAASLQKSRDIRVRVLYDPDQTRAQKYASLFGGTVASDPDAIFSDASIEAVALFVPPWVRKALFLQAIAANLAVITTKPLASHIKDCDAICRAAREKGITAGVIYNRTEDRFLETAKDLFTEGRFGRLALYRQDWIHAYPQWNDWATDPEKNGGPFMDAMIHNLNAACHLMGRPVARSTFFSDRLAHPGLKCADTESMVVHFEGGGVAHLFITWAADLAVHTTEGNDREHIDLFYLVTDQGWRLTKDYREGQVVLRASRHGVDEIIPCPPLPETIYDSFAAVHRGGRWPRNLATLDEASNDIRLIRNGLAASAG